MLKITRFKGINNVVPDGRLRSDELVSATDVDFGLSGEVSRRQGFSEVVAECYKNLWQADGFLLATRNGDLISRWPDGTVHVLASSLSSARVWYCNLPDGRTALSNGSIQYITDGLTAKRWGVPVPQSIGAATEVAGSLYPGDYQWQITYQRQSDGMEGGPAYSNPVTIDQGGIVLTGLPSLTGYVINVYLTGANGGDGFLAGQATGSVFSFTGSNADLTLPCRTDFLEPPPAAGTITAFWRGRVLLAEGATLWASRTNQWELFDPRRDFKQFSGPIRLVQPVDDGIYVGTDHSLMFLAGTEWDKLTLRDVVQGSVVLGSGVPIKGELVRQGRDVGQGSAMLCIVDGGIVAGFNGGVVERMTQETYHTAATEVCATVRMARGFPQYVAIPQ